MMKSRHLVVAALVCALVSAVPLLAGAPDQAAQSFATAQTLLAEGSFAAALQAIASAAKSDPANQQYREEYSLLRRIVKMRDGLDAESNPEKWETTAYALRSYYYGHDMHGEALALDRKIHAKLHTADSAALLAESLLQTDHNSEVIELLGAVSPEQATVQTRVLLGVAHARLNQTDQARALAAACALPEDAGPGLLYDVARLQALIGDQPAALATLTKCFESVPPSRLEGFKAYAQSSADLAALKANVEFPKVLATASKVKESECSSGSDCGTCPSRSKSCSSKDHASAAGK